MTRTILRGTKRDVIMDTGASSSAAAITFGLESAPPVDPVFRHERLRRKAHVIDDAVDEYRNSRGLSIFPHKKVRGMAEFILPKSKWVGNGAYKNVYRVRTQARNLVLKIGDQKHILNDLRVYRRFHKNVRNRYFAKIYWRTKYCLLQKFGDPADDISPIELQKLKDKGKENGLCDVKVANIRLVDGRYKIVDANIRDERG
jgi:hypothetical protein